MGLLDVFGGGGGGGSTTAKVEPPKWQKPYIIDTLEGAKNLYNQPGPYYYPDSTVAPINQEQSTGLQYLTNYAAPAQAQVGANSLGALNTAFASANPLQNPYFAATAQAFVDPATQALTRNILPQIDSGAVLAGQIGSSRQGIAQANAVNDYSRNLLNALAQYGTGAYNTGLDTLSRGLAVAPSISQLQNIPGQTFIGAGDYSRAYEQQLIDAARERYNYNQELPYNKLNYYAGIVGNPLGSVTSQGGGSGSRFDNTLSGAGTGAALGSQILPGWGTAIGGTIGALGGFFGGK